MRTRRLTSPAGNTMALTAGEFNLLAAFLRSPQQILTREQLLAASRVHDEEVFDRSRKLESNPSEAAAHQDGAWRRLYFHSQRRDHLSATQVA